MDFIRKLTENDTEEIKNGLRTDFSPIIFLSGCYPSLKEGDIFKSILQIAIVASTLMMFVIELFYTAYLAKDYLPIAIQSVHLAALLGIILVVLIIFNMERDVVNAIMTQIMKDFQYDDFGNLDISHFEKSQLRLRKMLFIAIPIYFLFVSGVVVVVTPVIEFLLDTEKPKAIEGVNMALLVPIWTFYSSEDPLMLYLTDFLQIFIAVNAALIATTAIICYISLNQRIISSLQILLLAIDNLEVRASNRWMKTFSELASREPNPDDFNSANFQYCYCISLKRCIEHHCYIVTFLKTFHKVVSLPGVLFVIISSFMIAASAYGMIAVKNSPAFQVQSFLYCLIEILVIFIICWYGEEISSLSLSISTRLYHTPWPECNEKVKKNMRIFVTNTMKPLTPIDYGVDVKLNLETFSNVINASYSYFSLLIATKIN